MYTPSRHDIEYNLRNCNRISDHLNQAFPNSPLPFSLTVTPSGFKLKEAAPTLSPQALAAWGDKVGAANVERAMSEIDPNLLKACPSPLDNYYRPKK